jgi:hypothetical protein
MSCVHVSSMICMVRFKARISGPVRVMFVHCMHRMLGRNCARHVHIMFWHVQLRIHDGMMLSCGVRFLCLH